MTIERLSLEAEQGGLGARAEGRKAYFTKAATSSPYVPGSFEHMCWQAGWNQDVRNVCELYSIWQRRN